MRTLKLLFLPSILVLAVTVAAPARAAQGAGPLRLELQLGTEAEATPELSLLDERLAGGGDTAAKVAPLVAFVLGIIPGFGIGHLVAGDSDGFVTWFVIDLVVTVAAVLTPVVFDAGGVVDALVVVAALGLRIVEGFSAMAAAERNWAWVEPGPGAPAYAGAAHALSPAAVRPLLRF